MAGHDMKNLNTALVHSLQRVEIALINVRKGLLNGSERTLTPCRHK